MNENIGHTSAQLLQFISDNLLVIISGTTTFTFFKKLYNTSYDREN